MNISHIPGNELQYFTVLQENLARALKEIKDCVQAKPSLPILSHVLLRVDVKSSSVSFTTTNLEKQATSRIYGKIEVLSNFEIAVPYKLLSELVDALPPERIDFIYAQGEYTLHTDKNTVGQTLKGERILMLECGAGKANIRCMDAAEFPIPVNPSDNADAILLGEITQVKQLKAMITYADVTRAKTDNRPLLTGFHVVVADNTLTIETANGVQLHKVNMPLDEYTTFAPCDFVVAGSLAERAKKWDNDQAITLYLETGKNNRLYLSVDGNNTAIQLITDKFPDTSAIIPTKFDATLRAASSGKEGDSIANAVSTLRKLKLKNVKFDYDQIVGSGDYDQPGFSIPIPGAQILDNYPSGISFDVLQLDSSLKALNSLFDSLSARGKRYSRRNPEVREVPTHVFEFGASDKPLKLTLHTFEDIGLSALAVIMPLHEHKSYTTFAERESYEDSAQRSDAMAASTDYYKWLSDNGLKSRHTYQQKRPDYTDVETFYSQLYGITKYMLTVKPFNALAVREVVAKLRENLIARRPQGYTWDVKGNERDPQVSIEHNHALLWLIAHGYAQEQAFKNRRVSAHYSLTETGIEWAMAMLHAQENIPAVESEAAQVIEQALPVKESKARIPPVQYSYAQKLALAWLHRGGMITLQGAWLRADGSTSIGYTAPDELATIAVWLTEQGCPNPYTDLQIQALYEKQFGKLPAEVIPEKLMPWRKRKSLSVSERKIVKLVMRGTTINIRTYMYRDPVWHSYLDAARTTVDRLLSWGCLIPSKEKSSELTANTLRIRAMLSYFDSKDN